MSLGLAPYFRRFELPWAHGDEMERRFKRLLRILLIISRLLPMPQRAKPKVEDLPERVVQLIVEKPKPPPPPPPPEPEKKPEPDKPKPVEQQKPTEKPKPELRKQMRAFEDAFADLRDNVDIQDPQMKTPVEDARSERNLIT